MLQKFVKWNHGLVLAGLLVLLTACGSEEQKPLPPPAPAQGGPGVPVPPVQGGNGNGNWQGNGCSNGTYYEIEFEVGIPVQYYCEINYCGGGYWGRRR